MGLSIGDFNSDGKLDIFVGGTAYDSSTCSLYSCRLNETGNELYLKSPEGRGFEAVTDIVSVCLCCFSNFRKTKRINENTLSDNQHCLFHIFYIVIAIRKQCSFEF